MYYGHACVKWIGLGKILCSTYALFVVIGSCLCRITGGMVLQGEIEIRKTSFNNFLVHLK